MASNLVKVQRPGTSTSFHTGSSGVSTTIGGPKSIISRNIPIKEQASKESESGKLRLEELNRTEIKL
jgi:hypothetical protein